MAVWDIEAGEGDVGSLQTARERAGIVTLGCCNLLVDDLRGPEVMCFLCLCNAVGRYVGIGPYDGSISV
jgi:hypothetical protein